MFLEERISVDIRYDSTYTDQYSVKVTTTEDGSEYRALLHAYPTRNFNISYVKENSELYNSIVNLYHRVYGKFGGFRAKAIDDFTTNGLTSPPTAIDQTLTLVSTGIYQLRKEYGKDKPGLSIGRPVRIIYKPVTGSVLVGVGGVSAPAGWTVDTTTGKVTFNSNKTASITGVTQASQAVVTVGSHSFLTNETVHFSSVAGMTQINNLRGLITGITGTTVTVNINSTSFSAYTSGGVINTNPQSGEAVTGGCEFDIPVRFDSDLEITQSWPQARDLNNVLLRELLKP